MLLGGITFVEIPARQSVGRRLEVNCAIVIAAMKLFNGLTLPNHALSDAGAAPPKRKVVLVVFLGGVTFAEIAALRFIGRQPEVNCAFVIATTKLLNGSNLLDTFVDDSVKAVREFAALR